MSDKYYTNLIGQLRDAADWINHQTDPAPDYEGLLVAAANAIQILYDWLPPFLLDEGDFCSNDPKQAGDQDK